MKYGILLITIMSFGIICKADPVSRDSLMTSSAAVVAGVELDRASGVDLRSRLIGRIPGLEVIEHSGQTVRGISNAGSPWFSSGKVSFSSKGWSTLACFVDGVPVAFTQFHLEPEQIESIRFVSDVADKAAVNPLASGGAIMITTKQGSYNSPMKITVSGESGAGFVDRMPEWVDGVTYARLNNLARVSAGYPKLYDDAAIAGYGLGNMYDREYPSVDYKSLMLRNTNSVSRFAVSVGGGSSRVKYYVSFSGLNEGDIFKVGPASDYNRINMTSSVTAKIGRWIEARASFMGLFSVERGNNSGIQSYREVPAIAFPVALGRSTGVSDIDGDIEGRMIYAVSRTFNSNPYAEVVDGGFYNTKSRSGMFTADINIGLGWLLKGLNTRSHLSFGSYYSQKSGKDDDYLAYFWSPSEDISDLSGHLGVKQPSKSVMSGFSYQTLNFTQDLWYELNKGRHSAQIKATFNLSNSSRSGSTYFERLLMGVLDAGYNYGNRYAASFVLQCSGASPYAPGHRAGIFPAATFTWNASNEHFLKDVPWLDDLKVYLQAGRIGHADIFASNFRYRADYVMDKNITFGPASAYQWFGTDKQTVSVTEITRHANPELTWPKIDEFDFGVDFGVLDGLKFGVKGYFINRTGLHTNTIPVYSDIFGWDGMSYYENYNENRTLGGEFSIGFARKFGDFCLDVSCNATTWRTINTKVANDIYLYPWQKKEGENADAYKGYVCIGRFETPEQIESLPKLSETGTTIGDLMYKDLNEDGIIDINDQKTIGNTAPKLRYAINLNLSYKNFSLLVTGAGRACYDIPLTNDYFWNGWGDGNYSAFVAENLGGDYPALSYNKSESNFVQSDFWLRKGGYFKLKTVRLSYTFYPKAKWIDNVCFSVTGGNLATITSIDYVDPEDIDAGVSTYPFFRTVMAGIKVCF